MILLLLAEGCGSINLAFQGFKDFLYLFYLSWISFVFIIVIKWLFSNLFLMNLSKYI